MLASITPLGERGRGRRWGATATAYVVGSAAAGAGFGLLLGLLGAALGRATAALWPGSLPRGGVLVLGLAAAACAAGALADLRLAGLRLRSPHRQVDEDWLTRYRGWVYGVGFGAQLGVGVATIVTSASVYVTFALALLSGSPVAGSALGAAFGLARALPVPAAAGVRSPESLRILHGTLDRWSRPAARSAVSAQALGFAVLGAGTVLGALGVA